LILTAAIVVVSGFIQAAEADQLHAGVQPDGRIVVPTNQILHPAGKQILFAGRTVDLAWIRDGKSVAIKNMNSLLFYDLQSGEMQPPLVSPAGFGVTGLLAKDNQIFVTDASNHLRIAQAKAEGAYIWKKEVRLNSPAGGEANPAGLAWSADGTVWIAATLANAVQRVDPVRSKVTDTVNVGVAPYTVVVMRTGKVYVSNWGGNPPQAGDSASTSSGTPIRVGLHPCGMTLNSTETRLFVANANSDSVSVIDTQTDEVLETIDCKPDRKLPLGSGSNAVALSPDSRTLYVANGTNNCICVMTLGAMASGNPDGTAASVLAGLIPTGWHPGAILVSDDGKCLVVANVKGHGALDQADPEKEGRRSRDHLGSISIIDVPDAAAFTREVKENNRLAYSIAGLDPPRADIKAVPVPERHGEPSCIKHVVYIIKENRTYDQIFGDMWDNALTHNKTFFNYGEGT
jgi:YVTN family beta-propeller protein